MESNNRKGIQFPPSFMKVMKKKKAKKIRTTPIDKDIVEKKFNDASMQL